MVCFEALNDTRLVEGSSTQSDFRLFLWRDDNHFEHDENCLERDENRLERDENCFERDENRLEHNENCFEYDEN